MLRNASFTSSTSTPLQQKLKSQGDESWFLHTLPLAHYGQVYFLCILLLWFAIFLTDVNCRPR